MDAYLELIAAAALADRALKQGLTASDAGRSLEQAASNEELYADLVRRCTEMARGAADSREKLLWMELTLAVRSSPAEVLLAALRNPEIAVAWRDDEEFRLVDDLPAGAYAVAGAYDQWLAWLRARGEARAAERVEAAVRVLAEVRPGE